MLPAEFGDVVLVGVDQRIIAVYGPLESADLLIREQHVLRLLRPCHTLEDRP